MSQTQVLDEDDEMSSTQIPVHLLPQVATPANEQAKRVKSKGDPVKIPGSPAGAPLRTALPVRRRLTFGEGRKRRRTHKKKMDSRRKKTRRTNH